MTHDEFVKLVAEMRRLQREYYKTRSCDVLHDSKRLERAVDEALRDLMEPQRRLFR